MSNKYMIPLIKFSSFYIYLINAILTIYSTHIYVNFINFNKIYVSEKFSQYYNKNNISDDKLVLI